MSNTLLIYNAHNGATYQVAKPVRFASLHKLKLHLHQIATHEVIGVENIILLTSFGIKLDFSMVNEMQELFLFDRRLFQKNAKSSIIAAYLAQEHPRKVNRPVAGAVQTSVLISETHRVTAQLNVMFRALNIIFQFTTNFIFAAEKAFENYAKEFRLLQAKSLHKTWRKYYTDLQQIPAVSFKNSAPLRLADFLSVSVLENASSFVQENMPAMVEMNAQMSAKVSETNNLKVAIDGQIAALRKQSVEKFQKKAQVVARLETHSKTLQAKELFSSALECYDLLQAAIAFKAQMSEASGEIWELIALSQMKSVEVKNGCKNLFEKEDTELSRIRSHEAILSMTIDLPLLFGFILIERRRQFEWADYFSKGVVHNITEQMTILIEHEKKFQTLWNKRFGSLLHNLDPSVCLQAQVPAVDVSLVNTTPKAVFAWFNFHIERDDLTSFIDAMRSHQPEKSVLLLERNFKDLVVSTGKLKSTTKIIASLSTSADYDNQSRIIRRGEVDQDADLSQMEGLRCRIKKLEDLLHQYQYKNLNGWPVLRQSKSFYDRSGTTSVLFEAKVAESKPVDSNTFGVGERPRILHHLSEPNNPIKLLGSEKKTLREPLDASGTIDKHLENIRLKRELKEMQTKVEAMRGYENLKEKYENLEEKYENLEEKYENLKEKYKNSEEKYENLKGKYENSEEKYENLKEKYENSDENYKILQEKYQKSEENYKNSEENYKNLEEKYENLEENYKSAQEKYQNLEENYKSAQEKYQNSEKNYKILQEKYQKSEEKYHNSEKNYKNSENNYLILQQKYQDSKNVAQELSQKLHNLNQEYSDCKLSQTESKLVTESKDESKDESAELSAKNSALISEISEVKSVNSELLSNMRAKEADFRNERSHLSNQLSQLQASNDDVRAQLDAKTEDFEALMDVMQGKSLKMDELMQNSNQTFSAMFHGLHRLLACNMAFFYEFCEILESMGLLLVAETNLGVTEFRIRRVKGLRSKKEQNEAHEIDVGGVKKTYRSAVVEEMSRRFQWIVGIQKLKADDDEDDVESQLRANVAVCSQYLPKIDDFLSAISFRNRDNSNNSNQNTSNQNNSNQNTSNQNNSNQNNSNQNTLNPDNSNQNTLNPDNEPFFLNAILKRFRDVEGFAKKLTKENRRTDKISVNNFQEGDLALFLPTKKEADKASPWAAFNLDAPHYFLDTQEELSDKEYILGRISRIEEHVVLGGEDNPYGLAEGIRWYSVSV